MLKNKKLVADALKELICSEVWIGNVAEVWTEIHRLCLPGSKQKIGDSAIRTHLNKYFATDVRRGQYTVPRRNLL